MNPGPVQDRVITGPGDFTDDLLADLAVIGRQIATAPRVHLNGAEKGVVYVVEFTSGLIKVGKAVNAETRLATHRRRAALHGVEIARLWVSDRHHDYGDSEKQVIAACAAWGERVSGEHFRGVAYDDIQEYAQRVATGRKRRAYVDQLILAVDGDLSTTWGVAHERLSAIEGDGEETEEYELNRMREEQKA